MKMCSFGTILRLYSVKDHDIFYLVIGLFSSIFKKKNKGDDGIKMVKIDPLCTHAKTILFGQKINMICIFFVTKGLVLVGIFKKTRQINSSLAFLANFF